MQISKRCRDLTKLKAKDVFHGECVVKRTSESAGFICNRAIVWFDFLARYPLILLSNNGRLS